MFSLINVNNNPSPSLAPHCFWNKKGPGFTLIELLVVVAIIGLISTVVLVHIGGIRPKARITSSLQFSQTILHTLGVDVVGIWDLDEGSGTIAYDRSGYGNNGIINGATYTDDTPHKAIGKGAGKYALRFDGVNDYVDVGNGESLKNMGSAVTVEAWAKYNAYGGGGQTYSVIAVKGSPWTFLLENPNNKIRFRVTAGGVDANAADSVVHKLNRWYHFVGTYDGANIRIYKDGVQVGITPRTGALAVNNNTAKIGTYTGTTYNFNGLIDEVRIYGRALSIGEIQQRYAEGAARHGITLK